MDKRSALSRNVLAIAVSGALWAACVPLTVSNSSAPPATIAAVQDQMLTQPNAWGIQSFKANHQCRIKAREQSERQPGCGPYPDLTGSLQTDSNDQLLQKAKTNFLVTSYYRNVESLHYPSRRVIRILRHTNQLNRVSAWPEGLPRFCLAMSGGGIRSAAFNIGVLQALSERGVLDQFDVISAASGGAYALGWLYAHLGDGSHSTMAGVLQDFSPAMRNATKYSRFINTSDWIKVGLLNSPFLAITVPWATLVSTSGHESIQIGNLGYEAAISITFMSQRDVPFTEVRATVEKNQLPVPIVNVAAFDLTSTPAEMNRDLLQNVSFEFTPYRMGSYGRGFSNNFLLSNGKDRLRLASVIALSGAALDDPSSLTGIRNMLSFGTGRTQGFVGTPVLASLVAVPDAPRVVSDTNYVDHRILLTDGGYADNLATYPLIQRMCRNIFIVDAEHDPDMEFRSYRCLKKRLRNEQRRNVNVQIASIDARDFSGDLSCPLNKDAPKEPMKIATSKRNDEPKHRKEADPVHIGKVGAFPFPTDMQPSSTPSVQSSVRTLESSIMLVKLSMDFSRLDDYPPLVKAYANACKKEGSACKFPHDPTSVQSFAPDQFHAYRELGRHNAHKALERLSYSSR